MAASPNVAWYRSFYWRIGITFVAFVVVILITQGLILSYTISSDDAQDQFRAPVLAAEVAADVASVLARDRGADLGAAVDRRQPRTAPRQAGRSFVTPLPAGHACAVTGSESHRR